MFDNWNERRRIKKELVLLKEKEPEFWDPQILNSENPISGRERIYQLQMKFDGLETKVLIDKVIKLGIELPKDKPNWWYDDLDYVQPDDVSFYLTKTGKSAVAKIIRDERKKNAEWWIKTIITLLATLTGLIGSIIGVLAFIYPKN